MHIMPLSPLISSLLAKYFSLNMSDDNQPDFTLQFEKGIEVFGCYGSWISILPLLFAL